MHKSTKNESVFFEPSGALRERWYNVSEIYTSSCRLNFNMSITVYQLLQIELIPKQKLQTLALRQCVCER